MPLPTDIGTGTLVGHFAHHNSLHSFFNLFENEQPIQWRGQLATAPAAPSKNDFYYNTTDSTLYYYDGGTWQAWITDTGGAGGVTSVFTRTGAVVAQSGDYSASLVTNDSGVTGATVAAALDWLAANLGATTFAALTDVTITAVQDNQTIQYNTATGKWENVDATTIDTSGVSVGQQYNIQVDSVSPFTGSLVLDTGGGGGNMPSAAEYGSVRYDQNGVAYHSATHQDGVFVTDYDPTLTETDDWWDAWDWAFTQALVGGGTTRSKVVFVPGDRTYLFRKEVVVPNSIKIVGLGVAQVGIHATLWDTDPDGGAALGHDWVMTLGSGGNNFNGGIENIEFAANTSGRISASGGLLRTVAAGLDTFTYVDRCYFGTCAGTGLLVQGSSPQNSFLGDLRFDHNLGLRIDPAGGDLISLGRLEFDNTNATTPKACITIDLTDHALSNPTVIDIASMLVELHQTVTKGIFRIILPTSLTAWNPWITLQLGALMLKPNTGDVPVFWIERPDEVNGSDAVVTIKTGPLYGDYTTLVDGPTGTPTINAYSSATTGGAVVQEFNYAPYSAGVSGGVVPEVASLHYGHKLFRNLGIGADSFMTNSNQGEGVMVISPAVTNPSGNHPNGVIMYFDSGDSKLKYRKPNGDVVVIG